MENSKNLKKPSQCAFSFGGGGALSLASRAFWACDAVKLFIQEAESEENHPPSTFGRGRNFNLSSAKVRNLGEGKMFALQTVADSSRKRSFASLKMTSVGHSEQREESHKPDCFTNNPTTAMRALYKGGSVRNDGNALSAIVPSKRIAFTLAEVLITLGIIGVVAAMTMPTLISNHQQKVLNTKVKKTYSNIQNAFLKLQNEYGTIGDNSVLFDASSNIEKLMQELSTHFNGAKLCKQRACPETNYTINYASNYYGEGGSILTLNFFNHRSILLPDGVIFSIAEFYPNCDVTRTETIYDKDGNETQKQNHITSCATLYFDVNGSKPPNTFGKDVFHLSIGRNKINHSVWPVTGGDVLNDIITGKN